MSANIYDGKSLWSPWIDVGHKILALRKAKGLSRAGLAKAVDSSEFYIEQLERGMVDPVDALLLADVARTLGVRLIELLPPTPEPKRYDPPDAGITLVSKD
jgi:transcriptional regulator with XRE-family HTH domain